MDEIKCRTKMIGFMLEGNWPWAGPQLVAECVYLQLRKILELVAIASAANGSNYEQYIDQFSKGVNTRRIFGDIERDNPQFYPIPIRRRPDRENARDARFFEEIESGFLTKGEWHELFDVCNKLIHAAPPGMSDTNYDDLLASVRNWVEKIALLLRRHKVQLVESDQWLLVEMKSASGTVCVCHVKVFPTQHDETVFS